MTRPCDTLLQVVLAVSALADVEVSHVSLAVLRAWLGVGVGVGVGLGLGLGLGLETGGGARAGELVVLIAAAAIGVAEVFEARGTGGEDSGRDHARLRPQLVRSAERGCTWLGLGLGLGFGIP